MSYPPSPPKKSSTGLWIGGAVLLLIALATIVVLLLNRQPAPAAPGTAVIVSVATATSVPSETPTAVATVTSAPTETPTGTPMPELGTSNIFIEYILDASGSMTETLSDGSPKIEVAQQVLTEHMRSFRPETNIGLRVYGHRLPYQQTAESCQDIELIAPPEKGQMERIVGWLQDFTVQGMTPLAASLEQAQADFVYDASRVNSIVMLSDGIETCGGDPCQLVEDLKDQGINFTIHVIGLDVDDDAQQQLSCIAQAGGGTYHDARSQEDLDAALSAVKTDVTQNEVVVSPGVNTPTPQAASPTPLPAANSPALAPLDRTTRASVLEWVFYALREGDPIIFDALVNDDGISYINYIEGGQPVTKADYLTDLAQRLPSKPQCDGYGEVATDRLQVWTSGWSPVWQMTEMCYGDCQPIDPPWTSDIAAFFLQEVDGWWTINAMWLNEMDIWLNVYGVDLQPCNGLADEAELPSSPTPSATPTSTEAPLTSTPALSPGTQNPSPAPGGMVVNDVDGATYVRIPAGEFTMGSTDTDPDATDHEKPQHRVYLDEYWIMRTEVTVEQYRRCLSSGVCNPLPAYRDCIGVNTSMPNHAVDCIDWDEANSYCIWAGSKLPTEAEWEKAARGSEGQMYPWGNVQPDCTFAVFGGQSCGVTGVADVGSRTVDTSPYGILDLAGNTSEWVADLYGPIYYSNSSYQNPTGPDISEADGFYAIPQIHTVRGGHWSTTNAARLRTSSRVWGEGPTESLGFRCVREP